MKNIRRSIAGLLCSVMLLAGLLTGLLAGTVQAAPNHAFILVVEAGGKLVAAPEYVTYEEGQNIRQALAGSGHTFNGLDVGMITAIDNVSGNYRRSDEDGDYNLAKSASEVQYYRFCELEDSSMSIGLQALMKAMADYQLEEPDVRNAAKEVYDTAMKNFVGISSDSAATLANDLSDAIHAYKSTLNSQHYMVTFEDDSAVCIGAKIAVKNEYGKVWNVDAEKGVVNLPKGNYTFSLDKDGVGASGNFVVTNALSVRLSLPKTDWINTETFRLSSTYERYWEEDGSKFSDGEFDLSQCEWKNRQITVPVKDTMTGQIYTYADHCVANYSSFPALKAYYTSADTGTELDASITLESTNSGISRVLSKGAKGNTIVYRISALMKDGYTYYQDYTVRFDRTPTLKSISVSDQEGTDQAATKPFSGDELNYTYKVLKEVTSVTVKAEPLASDYIIKVNGQVMEDRVSVDLNQENGVPIQTQVNVQVIGGEYQNEYTLTILPGEGQKITFTTSSEDVSLQVVNNNGMVMPCKKQNKTRYQYTLVTEDTYSYVATKDTYYHVKDEFVLSDLTNNSVSVDVPTEDWLNMFAMGSSSGKKYKGNIPLSPEFTSNDHAYQITYIDTEHIAYAWADSDVSDVKIEAIYDQQFSSDTYHGKSYTISLTFGNTTGIKLNRMLMDENPIENKLVIRLSKDEEGITYYQDYTVDIKRSLTLANITANCDGVTSTLIQEDGTTGYNAKVKEYSVKVPMAADALSLDITAYSGNNCYGESNVGYRVYVDGKDVTSAGGAKISIDGTINTQNVTIRVENAKAPEGSSDYILHILKSPPVAATFILNPSDAQISVYEVLSGERIWPGEDGSFLLCEGFQYDYVLTRHGYVSRSGSLNVTRDSANMLIVTDGNDTYTVAETGSGGGSTVISMALSAAPVNEALNTNLPAAWPNFRGNGENNGVTDKMIPTAAADGTLYWANKLGEGFDSGAVGSPIIVNDELITYAGNTIFRVDPVSGDILKTGIMSGRSSFAITPPAYADGMVFVALSNGTVQAFDAVSLESLWIYQDPLGGQPNCPLTIHNGYLYTGFWNSETADANFVCMSVTDEDPSDSDESKCASWYHTEKGGFYWAGAYAGDDFVAVGTDDGTNGCTGQSSSLLLFHPTSGELLDCWDGLNGDIRSSIVYDTATDAYYFTSKGGSFYSFKAAKTADGYEIVNNWEVKLSHGHNDPVNVPMSTCSPSVYNGRAYLGVSGVSQFSSYSGHNITVIDLESKKIAYRVDTQGYPQTSGLLTNAYGDYVYVYFFDNMTPGKLRVLRDKPGQTSADYITMEESKVTAYAIFTPTGNHAQYAICSPIVDEYGTVYLKNDSAYLMAFGSAIEKLEVIQMPDKLEYTEGEIFDPTGMIVTATYVNGKTRDVTDYISYSEEALTAEDTLFTITYEYVMYHNEEDGTSMKAGVVTTTPTAVIELTFPADTPVAAWDVNGDGEVTKDDAQMILDHEAQNLEEELSAETADLSGDGVIDSNDAVLLLKYLDGEITLDEIEEMRNDEMEE